MKQTIKFLIVFQILVIPLLIYSAPVSASGAHVPVQDENGNYHFRIEESQWQIRAYDIVAFENYLEEHNVDFELGDTDSAISKKYRSDHEISHRIGDNSDDGSKGFVRGMNLTLDVYSRDVQHGFSINEVDLNLATNRPTPGDVWGAPVSAEVVLPDEDITMSAFCHIFCGLGHPDMKLKLIVGAGSTEWGPLVYGAMIAVNVGIFALIGRSVFTKLDLEEEKNAATT